MCTGVEIAGLVMAAAGTKMQMDAQADAADKQQSIINNAQAETSRLNEKKADTIQNFASKTFDPTARDGKYEAAATKNESSLVDSLLSANNGKASEVAQGAEGKLSDDYTRAKAGATASATDDILTRARLMARNNAAGLMYGQEQLDSGQLSSDIGLINGSMQRTNNDARTQLSGVNNNGSLAGGLLTGLSGAVSNSNIFKKSAIPGMTG
jgi:hypothetical protein